ncbi:chemotaxis protein CheW [Planctomycetes bacterium K23_9]|uniref:CheW-like domain protein n=1 Tax=Stieleria marina TaxID=1930275 RepID=A0A517NM02_9BACT|nr:CheW-like domain protein [Planctomycetes bacterium K23_9]
MMIATQSNNETFQSTSQDSAADKKHCMFRSGGDWFAIPAVVVREITASPALVRVPDCHPCLAGICHLRAEFIPAISISGILEVNAKRDEEAESTLLVINGNVTWALLIAEAGSVETLEVLGNTEQQRETVELGTAMHRDQIVRVLDHNGIYQRVQQLVENVWALPDDAVVESLPPQTQSTSGSE